MTARAYLSQAYRLENRIKLIKERIEDLRELSTSVSSPGFEEHYNATKNTDAPFIRVLEKIMEYEEEYQEQCKIMTAKQAKSLNNVRKT